MNFPAVDWLNRRFGTPERIVFRQDEQELIYVTLANKFGACEVLLQGAHVLQYRPVGLGPALFVSKKSDFLPGKPVRGGIPVCWPWFGSHPADPAQPKHGIARILPWSVKASEYSNDATEIILVLNDTEITRALWPHAFDLRMRIRLEQALLLELTCTNTGSEPFEMTQAFHPYFQVGAIDQVSMLGLEQARCFNRVTQQETVHTGPFRITQALDWLMTPQQNECALVDEKLRRIIAMTYSGTRNLNIWNPGPNSAFPDLAPEEYARFLCIEPANARDTAIEMEPGSRHTLSMTLQVRLA